MTTAALEKRVRALEAQMKVLKSAVRKAAPTPARVSVTKPAKLKKLPSWLVASLKEVKEGKMRGPFHTVDELMADLQRPGV